MTRWVNPAGTRTYSAWRHMRYRCYKKSDSSYANYGGRGITVCAEWIENYDQFFADMGECPAGLTLERRDNDLGYSPINCKWATRTEQQNNRRGCRPITFNGRTQNMTQWAREFGIAEDTMRCRLKTMPLEKAFQSGSLNKGRVYVGQT